MLLAIDVGNTQTVLGLYEADSGTTAADTGLVALSFRRMPRKSVKIGHHASGDSFVLCRWHARPVGRLRSESPSCREFAPYCACEQGGGTQRRTNSGHLVTGLTTRASQVVKAVKASPRQSRPPSRADGGRVTEMQQHGALFHVSEILVKNPPESISICTIATEFS